ncbi:hypothetical protein C2857_005808 [Epichloe festucae Fl1]|uniref:Uncharacterized protein n=1 Tax=Epichloe festucae (strain Fl1) TaxID=877507 RepID=A0A7S9KL82_EPIFF|nr:hypothetical protein C2857_005808 [Epichloe festucae Fl1]
MYSLMDHLTSFMIQFKPALTSEGAWGTETLISRTLRTESPLSAIQGPAHSISRLQLLLGTALILSPWYTAAPALDCPNMIRAINSQALRSCRPKCRSAIQASARMTDVGTGR